MKKTLFALCISCCTLILQAQHFSNDSVFILPDTARPFTLENFYQLVIQYHPVVRQAPLLSDVAKQEIRLARGNFDPKLEAEFQLKHYNNTTYYRLFDGGLKFPTRSPVQPVVGLERNTGAHVNPENYIPPKYDYKQMYAGITVPLGRGLFTDERRTALRQAELFGDMMEAEQVTLINKLLLHAANDYWQWYFSYYNYRLATNNARIADEIFNRVKLNFEGGEIAVIDTVQSKITLLERQVDRQEAFAEFSRSTLGLSTYLWDSLMHPVDLSHHHAPVAEIEMIILSKNTLEELVNMATTNHPDLRKFSVKLEQLEFDRRFAAEFMKPKLDVTYYMLNQPLSPEGLNGAFALHDNYKLGIDLSFPLFLRKERAKLAQTRIKISNTIYDRNLATREIVNDINTAHTLLLNSGIIIQQQRDMVENYERLLAAELTNLENGESDLFKINVQQEKLFNAHSKLLKVMAEYEKQKALLYWSAGVRPLQ